MARRRRYSDNHGAFPEYVPVSERRRRNQQAAETLRGNRGEVQPVSVEGRKIARTWWGESWNANLERYADYSNRIGRGRSYVRHGAVLDLWIGTGEVSALVQGSRRTPYEVNIVITPLDGVAWEHLRQAALSQLDSLADLLAGKFPRALRETFFAQGTGLFPTPKEISFDCSCPDWASMCKHVAAVLYGIGNRLDEQPGLLFTLRRVSMEELIDKTIDATARNLLDKAETALDGDVLDEADVGSVFGIEFDDTDTGVETVPSVPPVQRPASQPTTRTTGRSRSKPEPSTRTGKGGAGKRRDNRSATRTTPRPAAKQESGGEPASSRGTMVDRLMAAVPRGRKAFDTSYLFTKLTAWSETQVRNTISRAIRDGRIERVAQGAYRRSSS